MAYIIIINTIMDDVRENIISYCQNFDLKINVAEPLRKINDT